MKKLAALAAVATATIAMADGAQAAAPSSIKFYDLASSGPSQGVAFGQLFSKKGSCVAGRKFKLVVRTNVGRPKTVDKGTTSEEGALSALVTTTDLTGITDINFVAAKTKKCGKASAPLTIGPIAAGRAAATTVDIVGAAGIEKDGAFAGTVGSGKSSCRSNRKVKLFRNGKVLDTGVTTQRGSWALHVTRKETSAGATFKVTAAATKQCKAGKDVIAPT